MDIRASARKHGIANGDILHAVRNALRYIEHEYDGEARVLLIGPSRTGDLLEVVFVADEPARIIHADRLRAKSTSA